MAETLIPRGELHGHRGWVTAIAPSLDASSDLLVSASRYVPLTGRCGARWRFPLHYEDALERWSLLWSLRSRLG